MFENTISSFNQSSRLGSDVFYHTQDAIENRAYMSHTVNDLYTGQQISRDVQFATQQPGLMINGVTRGMGLGPSSIEQESNLLWKSEGQRPLEKLQLFPRPFLTVPYLGKGSCDPNIESQLMQGESVRGKKSISTVMEQNFLPLDQYPLEEGKRNDVSSAKNIQELAFDGWVRGGKTSRDTEEKYLNKRSKPNLSA
jgi:hypothetical protein